MCRVRLNAVLTLHHTQLTLLRHKHSDEIQERVDDVIQRLAPDATPFAAPLRRQADESSNGITIYRVEDDVPENPHFSVRKAVELDILAPLEDLVDAWWHQEERYLWDNRNMLDSSLLQEIDPATRVWVYKAPARPGLVSTSVSVIGREVPARLFHHSNSNQPPEARAFVQLFNDNFEQTISPWAESKFKSLLLLVADEPAKTRCIYVAELGAATANTPRERVCEVADDIAQVLHLLKSYVESGNYHNQRMKRTSQS